MPWKSHWQDAFAYAPIRGKNRKSQELSRPQDMGEALAELDLLLTGGRLEVSSLR